MRWRAGRAGRAGRGLYMARLRAALFLVILFGPENEAGAISMAVRVEGSYVFAAPGILK